MKIYMEVTNDEYELPVAIADSVRELEIMTGRAEKSIASQLSKYKHGKIKTCIFKEVEIGDCEREFDVYENGYRITFRMNGDKYYKKVHGVHNNSQRISRNTYNQAFKYYLEQKGKGLDGE